MAETQEATQPSDGLAFNQSSFDPLNVIARFVSTSNTDLYPSITLERLQPGTSYRFGRHRSCEVVLDAGPRISNNHFVIWEVNGNQSSRDSSSTVVMIQDLSTNGTFINQIKLGKQKSNVLSNGDEISIGLGVDKDEIRYIVQLPRRYQTFVSGSQSEENYMQAKYDIREVLGSGAFATVKRCVERTTGKQYAVKIMNKRKLALLNVKFSATEFYRREIEILQATKHPNIVEYVDLWSDNNEIFLILEFVEGGDLMDYIIKRRSLDERSARSIVKQLLEALCYCHKLGISHRDIKPENVLLTLDDQPIAKLTDFGLAKMVEPGSHLKTFCGTLSYVAPEMITQHGQTEGGYSVAVDMWSLGCCVYIMLVGSMPFGNGRQEDLMQIIQTGNYDVEALEDIELSGPGMDFIEGLLQVDPKERYTADEALRHPWMQAEEVEAMDSMSREEYLSQTSTGANATGNHIDPFAMYDLKSREGNLDSARIPGAPGTFGIDNNWYISTPAPSQTGFPSPFSSEVASSSQYKLASSQLGAESSNVTITPTRLRQEKQNQKHNMMQHCLNREGPERKHLFWSASAPVLT